MLNATVGSLVIVDANTGEPKFFWRGQQIVVDSFLAGKNDVLLRVSRGSIAEDVLADMRASNIDVKEIK